ncbi:galactose-1-phosphate uridylyltransferase [Nitratifractor salsuginis]|uniref:Galactose-1-phosphate uridylyltransferase n=1 Tax=Nitratifractor salsuginis (strain DSM 16511 / JCM 12458 / E9I37-1) TaxID=749222 RepID=E6X3H0_NITSE|nr:galactose-1-phosphate uridylyltransferase [Nitratifractor salsuginis]ADV46247.1 galactose-1-phosphate uridylyltransferase [Nitratifractor salsuginis DSM 16511]
MSELRYDLLHDEYILIAPERLHRPLSLQRAAEPPEPALCPFCPGHEDLTPPEIYALRDSKGWHTRVVPNRYKAVQIETPFEAHREGVNERWGGFGAHEIVINTPRHDATLATMSEEEIFDWLYTVRERVADLSRDQRLVQIDCFKNHGLAAGASQPHPHSQILALPVMSKAQKAQFRHAHRYWREHGRSLYEDIIEQESRERTRTLIEGERFFSYCPYASSFAFESVILSRNCANITELNEEALRELAATVGQLFVRLHRELGPFAYNLLFILPPVNRNFENEEFFDELPRLHRFYLRITPRIYTLAGYELMSQSAINPVAPELAAGRLRSDDEPSR